MTSRKSASATTYVALLRGINVGGRNMVSMTSLRGHFERLGFDDVSTYINSGNVLFRAREADPRKLESRIDAMLQREYGLTGKTVVRSRAEMGRLVETIDRTWDGDPAWRCTVVFLRHAVDSRQVLDGIPLQPDAERVVYCPGTLLWAARVDAAARSAMLKMANKPLGREMTVRNVNTTRKLLELMRRMDGAST